MIESVLTIDHGFISVVDFIFGTSSNKLMKEQVGPHGFER